MPFFAFFAAAASAAAAFLTSSAFIAQTAIAIGLTAAQYALAKKNQPSKQKAEINYKQSMGSGADSPRAFIVGKAATSGTVAYHNSWGWTSGIPNAFYTRVTAVSDLPVKGLSELWVNGEKCTIAYGDPDPDGRGYPIIELTNTFDVEEVTTETITPPGGGDDIIVPRLATLSKVSVFGWIKFYDGSQTTVDNFIETDVATTERPWSGIGDGIAYAVLTLRYHHNFAPNPVGTKVTYVVEGIEVDNPAGGSIEGDTNPIRLAYHLAKGITYNGEWFYGPQYAPTARLDPAEWATAAAACDVDVPGASSMTDAEKIAAFGSTTIPPRYEYGAEVTVDVAPVDFLDSARAACNGRFYATATGYKMQVGDPIAPVASIEDGDLRTTAQQTFDFFPTLSETANAITATYTEPDEGWTAEDAPGHFDVDLEAEDGNRRLVVNLDLPGVFRKEQVQRLQASAAKEERRHKRINRTVGGHYASHDVGDYLSVSSEDDGFVDKLFRIDGRTDTEVGDVSFALTEHDSNSYDWDASTDYTAPDFGSVAPQPITIVSVPEFAVTAVVIDDGAGVAKRAGVLLTWDDEIEDTQSIIWQARRDGTTAIIAEGTANNPETGSYLHENTTPASDLQYRARSVPVSSRQTAWTSWLDVTTEDVRIQASDLATEITQDIENAEAVADAAAAAAVAAIAGADAANAAISQEITDRIALGQVVDSLSVDVSDNSGALATVAQDVVASAEFNTAISGEFETYDASVAGGLSASVTSVKAAQATTDGWLTAYAGLTVNTSGGKIAGFKATSYVDPDGNAGGVLELLGQVIALNSLSVESLTVGLGRNDIVHSIAKASGLAGWSGSSTGSDAFTFSVRVSTSYNHPIDGVFQIVQTGSDSSGLSFLKYFGTIDADGALADGLPVTPGEYYDFSAGLSVYECEARVVGIWYDSSGNEISRVNGNTVTVAGSSTDPTQWARSGVVGEAPAGAAFRAFAVRKSGTISGSASTLRFYQPMTTKSRDGAEASAYSAPGTVFISGDMISADVVRAKVATFGTLSALGFTVVTADIGDLQITRGKVGNNEIVSGVSSSFGFLNMTTSWSEAHREVIAASPYAISATLLWRIDFSGACDVSNPNDEIDLKVQVSTDDEVTWSDVEHYEVTFGSQAGVTSVQSLITDAYHPAASGILDGGTYKSSLQGSKVVNIPAGSDLAFRVRVRGGSDMNFDQIDSGFLSVFMEYSA